MQGTCIKIKKMVGCVCSNEHCSRGTIGGRRPLGLDRVRQKNLMIF